MIIVIITSRISILMAVFFMIFPFLLMIIAAVAIGYRNFIKEKDEQKEVEEKQDVTKQ